MIVNHKKHKILMLLFVFFYTNSFCQSLENFNDVLVAKKIGKVVVKKVKQDISERTYLGSIKDNTGNVKYYVVKEFLRVKAAIVYHGHSRILFFNPPKKLELEAILSMPYELPFKLKNNSLHFNYSKNKKKKIHIEDVATLNKMLCVEPKSCYDISKP